MPACISTSSGSKRKRSMPRHGMLFFCALHLLLKYRIIKFTKHGGGACVKIAILGHSGSGKSTLARQLGDKYGLPVLHFDSIHFLPGWVETDRPYKREKVNAFLDAHPEGWVIDGNYFKVCARRRFEEADHILYLDFPRRVCVPRAFKRLWAFRGKTRPDMGPGCPERIDRDFFLWLIRDGRTTKKLQDFLDVKTQHPDKFHHFTSPKQLKKELKL